MTKGTYDTWRVIRPSIEPGFAHEFRVGGRRLRRYRNLAAVEFAWDGNVGWIVHLRYDRPSPK